MRPTPLCCSSTHSITHALFQITVCLIWRQMPLIKDVFYPASYTLDHSVGHTGACDLQIAHTWFMQSRDCAHVLHNLEIVHTCYAIPRLLHNLRIPRMHKAISRLQIVRNIYSLIRCPEIQERAYVSPIMQLTINYQWLCSDMSPSIHFFQTWGCLVKHHIGLEEQTPTYIKYIRKHRYMYITNIIRISFLVGILLPHLHSPFLPIRFSYKYGKAYN